ncbi:GNAT family N-acetyltransferase [Candidatus Woesearchaeota archaeon]|nr:GNAT family N-acetyltransferase [Candidatus Woesearchaeota archaeon]
MTKIKIKFRSVEEKDCNFLLGLRNDPVVVRNSIVSEPVDLETHKKWFRESLKNPNRKIFIIVFEGKDIGQARFDRQDINSAEISISIISDYRGRGLGSKVIKEACRFAFFKLGYRGIIAQIKNNNIASSKSFSKAGFVEKEKKNNLVVMELMEIKKGLKIWSTNMKWFDQAKKLFDNKKIDYIELYVVPGSFEKSILKLKGLNVPMIIHAPHSFHNFNLADWSLHKSNISKFEEVKKFAKELNAPKIIVHPGYNGDINSTIECLDKFNYKDILIENQSKIGLNNEEMICYLPKDIKLLLDKRRGFCLDFSHVYKAAASLNKDPKELINEFLKLNPYMFHICDGDSSVEKDEHLSLGEGNFDLEFLKKGIRNSEAKMVSFEVPKKGELDNDIKSIEYFNSL